LRARSENSEKGDHYENDTHVISYALAMWSNSRCPRISTEKYGFWRLETLPIIPEKFGLKPVPESKERFNELKKLMARKDISRSSTPVTPGARATDLHLSLPAHEVQTAGEARVDADDDDRRIQEASRICATARRCRLADARAAAARATG